MSSVYAKLPHGRRGPKNVDLTNWRHGRTLSLEAWVDDIDRHQAIFGDGMVVAEIARDVIRKAADAIEERLHAMDPGERLCVHTLTLETLRPGTFSDRTIFRGEIDAHAPDEPCELIERDPSGMWASRIRSVGSAHQYASPWPCAFCHRRAASDWARPCPGCRNTWMYHDRRVWRPGHVDAERIYNLAFGVRHVGAWDTFEPRRWIADAHAMWSSINQAGS